MESTVIARFTGVEDPEQLKKDLNDMLDGLSDGGESVPEVTVNTVPEREIPNTNQIGMFFHCAKCMKDKPEDQSPKEWARTQTGFTPIGFQVWCNRCECNVFHMDLEGMKHPANTSRKA